MELDRYSTDTLGIARKLGYHVQYVRLLASSGKIPAMKRGRKWLFDEAEVLAFFKKQTDNVLKGKSNVRESADGSDILR